MQITISLGLEDLSSLPLELRQKIQQALNLPVAQPVQSFQAPANPTPAQYAEALVQHVQQQTPAVPQQPVFSFQPQQPVFQVPTKEPVMENGVRTFHADRNNPTAVSVAMDVTTGQQVPLTPPPSAPVIPQFQNAPVQVAALPVQAPVAPMTVPSVDINTVRSAAIRLFNRDAAGKQQLAAAEASCGVRVNGLTPDNCGALAVALRQQGVQI